MAVLLESGPFKDYIHILSVKRELTYTACCNYISFTVNTEGNIEMSFCINRKLISDTAPIYLL